MSNSSPADLAVAFQSLTRRLDEAGRELEADRPDTAATSIAGARRSVDAAVAAAAGVLGSAASVDAVVAAIKARHVDEWSDADLASIQSSANEAAKAIRALQAS